MSWAIQWVRYGPAPELIEAYLCGPELTAILRETGEEKAADLVDAMLRRIEEQQEGWGEE